MSENTNTSNDNVEIGALWKKQGKSQKFLSGTINLKAIGYDKDVPVIVFTNKFKQKDSHPDLRIYLSKPKGDSTPVKKSNEKPLTSEVKKSNTLVKEEPVASIDDDVM